MLSAVGCVCDEVDTRYSVIIITLGIVFLGLFWFLHVVSGSVYVCVCRVFNLALMSSCLG